jgi:hypothetical protein
MKDGEWLRSLKVKTESRLVGHGESRDFEYIPMSVADSYEFQRIADKVDRLDWIADAHKTLTVVLREMGPCCCYPIADHPGRCESCVAVAEARANLQRHLDQL